jgi:type II secretory pathway pseudopilin PulG
LTLDGQAALELRAELQTDNAMMLAQLEGVLRDNLQKLDERRARSGEAMAPEMQSTTAKLAADPDAPAPLKRAAEKLTLEQVMDPRGVYAPIRKSVQIARAGNSLTAQLTLPAPLVHDFSHGNMAVAAAVVGVAAAIAIPNFLKFQCRARQTEARVNLKALYTAQRAYQAENGKLGESFEKIGFAPERGNRYAYCIDGQCLPCTASECMPPDAARAACDAAMGPPTGAPRLRGCAAARINGANDIWLLEERGYPEPVENACH